MADSRRPSTPRWVWWTMLAVGVLVAATAGSMNAPDYALHSNFLWRCEVGAATAALSWLPLRTVVLAWHGWTWFGRLD